MHQILVKSEARTVCCVSAGLKAAVTTIILKCLTALTTVPLCSPGFVMGQGAPSPRRPTSCPFASSAMAASRREGSRLNTTPDFSMGAQVSPRPSGWGPSE